MASTGYSGTPLLKKLGISPGMKLLVVNPPADYFLWLEEDIRSQYVKDRQVPDLIHVFAENVKQFTAEMKPVLNLSRKNTKLIVWVSWYKKSSGIATDLTEDKIRAYALANKLVDVKVCAVSNVWSGLKLVVPVSLR